MKLVSALRITKFAHVANIFQFFPPPSQLVVRAGLKKNKNSAQAARPRSFRPAKKREASGGCLSATRRRRRANRANFTLPILYLQPASFTTYVFAGSVILPFQTNCIAASGSKGAEYCTTLFWCCRPFFRSALPPSSSRSPCSRCSLVLHHANTHTHK